MPPLIARAIARADGDTFAAATTARTNRSRRSSSRRCTLPSCMESTGSRLGSFHLCLHLIAEQTETIAATNERDREKCKNREAREERDEHLGRHLWLTGLQRHRHRVNARLKQVHAQINERN